MPDPLPQLNEEDVKGMTPEQIVEARKAGQLNEYLGVPVEPAPATTTFEFTDEEGQPRAITPDDLAQLEPEQIVALRKAGRLRHLGVAP